MELFGESSDSDERPGKIPADTSDRRYVSRLSVRELKDTLREMGLKVSGNKEELIERVLKGEDDDSSK